MGRVRVLSPSMVVMKQKGEGIAWTPDRRRSFKEMEDYADQ